MDLNRSHRSPIAAVISVRAGTDRKKQIGPRGNVGLDRDFLNAPVLRHVSRVNGTAVDLPQFAAGLSLEDRVVHTVRRIPMRNAFVGAGAQHKFCLDLMLSRWDLKPEAG